MSTENHSELNGVPLKFSDKVMHLCNLLTFDLSDKEDIITLTRDVNHKQVYIHFGISILF